MEKQCTIEKKEAPEDSMNVIHYALFRSSKMTRIK